MTVPVITKQEKEWRPTIKQGIFLSLPDTIKEGFYAGALGAGKSDVLLLLPIVRRFHENSDFKGLFLRRTFPELKNEIIPRSLKIYRAVGGKYNKNDKVWEFPSGALIFFGHCENEEDVHNYDSMQPNYVAFDELTSFTEWQYLYITIERNRANKRSGLPAITRSASNPGNVGHNWVRKRFIDPEPDGMTILTNRTGLKRIFIPATIDDNPHITLEYRQQLESLPEAEKQAKLYGKWDAFEGSVFDEFRDKKYPDEPDNAMHVVDSFDIPEFWPKIVVGDWGYAAMTWIGYLAISPEKRVYLYREQTFKRLKIEEWAPYVKQFIEQEHPREVRFCQSAGQKRGQEQSIHEQLETALDCSIGLSDNSAGSRVAGKILLHEYLRWKPRYVPEGEIKEYDNEYAMWLFRNRPLVEYKAYLNFFNPQEEEDNLPKLLIFSDANAQQEKPELVNAIKTCIYDKNRVEDVAPFDGDDPYDGIRYGLEAVDQYFQEAEEEFSKMQQRDFHNKQLAENQDFTAYYRNMRKIESEDVIKPVKRFHRGRRGLAS